MMDKVYYSPSQDPEFQRTMRQLRNARTRTVLHHETCPVCGAKLVNLYRKNTESGEWKCKKCWDKAEALARLEIVEVNPDFKEAVDANDGYCPCLIDRSEDTKCPCKDFREQTEPGSCHCGRFEKIVCDTNG